MLSTYLSNLNGDLWYKVMVTRPWTIKRYPKSLKVFTGQRFFVNQYPLITYLCFSPLCFSLPCFSLPSFKTKKGAPHILVLTTNGLPVRLYPNTTQMFWPIQLECGSQKIGSIWDVKLSSSVRRSCSYPDLLTPKGKISQSSYLKSRINN